MLKHLKNSTPVSPSLLYARSPSPFMQNQRVLHSISPL